MLRRVIAQVLVVLADQRGLADLHSPRDPAVQRGALVGSEVMTGPDPDQREDVLQRIRVRIGRAPLAFVDGLVIQALGEGDEALADRR